MGGTVAAAGYRWSFARIGGVDQVVLRHGDDIVNIPSLDRKLWAALSMPVANSGAIRETLDLLDADRDGRIRDRDVVDAIGFAAKHLSSLDEFLFAGQAVRIADIRQGPMKDAAEQTLELAGNKKAQEISLTDIVTALERLNASPANGDGIVPAEAVQDPEIASAITDLAAAGYAVPDLNGAPGIGSKSLETFMADSAAVLAWHDQAQSAKPATPGPFDAETAWAAYTPVRDKVEDWFLRSRLLANPAHARISGSESEAGPRLVSALSDPLLSIGSAILVGLPLADPDPACVLAPDGIINPAWEAAYREMLRQCAPLVGADPDAAGFTLDAATWRSMRDAMDRYGAWVGARPSNPAAKIGAERLAQLREIAGGEALAALIRQDEEAAALRNTTMDLRTLVNLRRDLVRILRNFVNFTDFYDRRDGIFQSGRLFMDGRECELCLDVADVASHAALASMSGIYLAYCACSRKDGASRTIVAAFTAGDADQLFVGRNGIFYDRDGIDWDARIVRIAVQPISIREAFFSPYKWLVKSIEDAVQKRAAAADSSAKGMIKSSSETAVSAAAGDREASKKSEGPKKMDVGTVAAIGVALGSIGAMVTGILGTFMGMGIWMPIGLVSVVLLISGPSMILAYMKLRRRNLGPLLDAQGWAINGRLKINVPFGGTLTHLAVLPAGTERTLKDPFGEKKRPWKLYITVAAIVALLLLWVFGALDGLLPAAARYSTIIGG